MKSFLKKINNIKISTLSILSIFAVTLAQTSVVYSPILIFHQPKVPKALLKNKYR